MTFIARALARIARNRPTRLIRSGDKPYLYRIFLFELWGWRCYLHHFVSADAERWIHDHPFDGLAIVLTGSYVEERLVAMDWPHLWTVRRTVRWFNRIAGTCFHRIVAPRRNTWTLLIHGPKYKGWGFLQAFPDRHGIAYINPYGNVGDLRWWLTAPRYADLRATELWDEARCSHPTTLPEYR